MSEEQGAEKSHEPTPQKLEDARRKGEIPKSQDVSVAASYLGVLLALTLTAGPASILLVDSGGRLLANADQMTTFVKTQSGGGGGEVLGQLLMITGLLILPPAALVLAGIIAQRAIVFAPEKVMPKLSRISIISNAKNKFGPTGLFEFAKSAVKMTGFIGLLVYFLVYHVDRLIVSAASGPRSAILQLGDVLTEFIIYVFIVSAAIAVVDFGWQRHSFTARNRMTRQEVLDETKQSEGDPHLKARRRQKAQEIATNSMMHDVPEASVVIVNPTHYAVALKWSPMDPTPPVCVAKGVDAVAAKIREIASEHRIPIYSDPPTARALFAATDVGDAIERDHFAAVAAAIRFARELQGEAQP
ncbi:MAG: flagellar type III secretion system protein FlhB [Pseudomonadota bacterium]